MRVRIQDEIGHTRRRTRIQRLLETGLVEVVANGIRPDHRDRFAVVILQVRFLAVYIIEYPPLFFTLLSHL